AGAIGHDAFLDRARGPRGRRAAAASPGAPGPDLGRPCPHCAPHEHLLASSMNSSWDQERRNYRGGQNRPIWIVDLKTYDLVSPPWTDSRDEDPVWVGDTVFFLSDRDGVSNVWSFDTKAKRLAQITKFPYFDVKT